MHAWCKKKGLRRHHWLMDSKKFLLFLVDPILPSKNSIASMEEQIDDEWDEN